MAPSGAKAASRPSPPPPASPPEHALYETNESYAGWGAPGGVTRRAGPATQRCPGRTAPPRLPPAYSPRGLNSRQPRVLGGAGTGHHGGGRGEGRGHHLPPPDNASPGGVCTKRSRIELRGRKIPPGQPHLPHCSRCGARVPIWLAALVVPNVDVDAEVLAPIPPLLASGGAGGIRAKGLKPFPRCNAVPPSAFHPRAHGSSGKPKEPWRLICTPSFARRGASSRPRGELYRSTPRGGSRWGGR